MISPLYLGVKYVKKNSMNDLVLSIIIPVYNEAENLETLHQEIISAIKDQYPNYEIIFINDGSMDDSQRVLTELHKKDKQLKIIHFRKNFGQSAAISAGIDHCSGDVIITLDADLQNDPADIPLVVEKLMEGYDMVNGWRKDRKDPLLSKKIPSFFGNKLVSFITKVKLHDYGCSLRAFRRDVAKNLKLYGEMHRYVPAIASRMGIKSVEIPVNHRKRLHGKSKYGIGRTFRVILDLISIKYLLSFSHRPLQVFGGMGLLMMSMGFLSGLWLTYVRYIKLETANRPLLFLTVLLIFLGFQMITLGLIAEMLTRIYNVGLKQTVYSVREMIGFADENLNDSS